MEHAKIRFGGRLIQELDQLLRRHDLDDAHRTGLLRFAGHMGEPSLGAAAEACWSTDKTREERLADYLWAFARCCDPATAAQYLDPVCAAWAALPQAQGHLPSPRDDLAAHNVLWAFQRALPLGALDYFIARARQPDLHWQITYMLHSIDDPRVVAFIAAELGAMRAKAESSGGFSPFSHTVIDQWRRAQEEGRPMAAASRDLLCRIWQDQTVDIPLRIAAFDIWAATKHPGDVAVLQNATGDTVLADRVLRQRLDRADSSAVPALIEKLRDREYGYGWWFHARHVWCPELTQALDEVLTWRRNHVAQGWGEAIAEDWHTQEMIMRLPVEESERLLLKHWNHLKFSTQFVQAALYVATPELCQRAAASIAEAPDRISLFKHISQNWGIRTFGRQGITRESQVLALQPYLDLITISDLNQIADACNRLGWFDLRKRFLDARFDSRRCSWSSKDASAQFDSLVANDRRNWIVLQIRDALETGASWREYLAAMRAWLTERQLFEALQLLATALAYYGSRQDLSALSIYDGMPREAAEALITDVTFAVNRRTPD